jgi:hypothetical protein
MLGQIHLEIRIDSGPFISAGKMAHIIALTQQAAFEMELADMKTLRKEFGEIPPYIYDAASMRLWLRSGNSFLIKEVHSGSIILGGIAVGLAIWLLEKTLGETLKEAWVESDTHSRLKQFLLTRLDGKRSGLGKAVHGKLERNGIQAEVYTTGETVVVYILSKEDDEIIAATKDGPEPYGKR